MQTYTREEVISLLAEYGDYFYMGMQEDKWIHPFRGNIEIAIQWLREKEEIK